MRAVQLIELPQLFAMWLLLWLPATVYAEPQSQQAAAQAYDRGSAAFSAGDYSEAASWFETAYRHAPTAEALIVAARSHARAGNRLRAATLALVLREMYPSHSDAIVAADEILTASQTEFLRVKVVCDQCALEVDGRLQAEHEFFIEPDQTHTITASNGTDEQTKQFGGSAGQDVLIMFSLAAPSNEPIAAPARVAEPIVQTSTAVDSKPFSPLTAYVAAGVTGALLIGSIALTVHTMAGVSKYEAAAEKFRQCTSDCDALEAGARTLAEKGHANETRTTLAWSATAVFGLATAAVALWWTDWDDGDASATTGLQFAVSPGIDLRSGSLDLRGEF